MIQPMLAVALDVEKLHKASGYSMEPKLDGWRCIVEMINGQLLMYSRTGKPFTDKVPPELRDVFHGLGKDYILDGELGYGRVTNRGIYLMTNEDYQHTASVLGSLPDEAQRKAASLAETGVEMQFIAFDFLQAGGHSLLEVPQGVRHEAMVAMMQDAFVKNEISNRVTWIDRWEGGWNEETYTQLILDGAEGVMLKNPNATYQAGKRPANHWFKVKKFNTLDVIITGFKPGEGKYAGQLGAIEFSLWDSETDKPGLPIGKCSGMDDGLRNYMSMNEAHYIGTVMEIKYFGKVGKDGAGLRHPNFLRLRGDKDPQDCTLD